jgi:hypothetical protein
VRFFPGVWKHSFEVDLFMAVGTGLFLSNNAPTSDTKFMKLVGTSELIGVFYDPLLSNGEKFTRGPIIFVH